MVREREVFVERETADGIVFETVGEVGVGACGEPVGIELEEVAVAAHPAFEAAGDADGDGIPNNQDARPNDNKAGRLTVVITVPVNGGVSL
jgi:hypothetical protein